MSSFAAYLWSLLSRPFKRQTSGETGKYVETLGGVLDAAQEDIFAVRRAWFVDTAPDEALPYLGDDRGIARLEGESNHDYRQRIKQAFEWYYWLGTKKGMLSAIALVTDVPCQILEYQLDSWKLGKSTLGRGTRLYNPALLFIFGLLFDQELSPDVEAAVQRMAKLAKPAHTMFHIICLGKTQLLKWYVGTSRLGRESILQLPDPTEFLVLGQSQLGYDSILTYDPWILDQSRLAIDTIME